jgi:hypothetical protein
MKAVPLLLFLSFPCSAFAQDSLGLDKPVFLYGLAFYDVPKGFGFTIGASVPFHSVANLKTGTRKTEFISSELGEHRYPFAYTSILFKAGLGVEYVRSSKHFSELSFGQGFLRTLYDGEVYELDQNGNIKSRKLYGRTYFITQVAYSLNYRVYNKSPRLWFQFRPCTWLQYPYNSFLKLHFSLQAGISYCLKNHAFS